MSMHKIAMDLTGVPQTLLLPLVGRAHYSQTHYSPIHDKRAIQLTQSLNYDFDDLLNRVGRIPPLWWIARAYEFDEAIKNYLQTHPKATIVNLGAGLETAFYRVDNEELTWVDLDLPEVIALRNQLLPPSDRVHHIAKSALDFTWIDDVKQYGNDVFFFAGGFFMYFSEKDVKSLFLNIAKHFPRAEIIFDTLPKYGIKYGNAFLQKVNMPDAIMKWGIDRGSELEAWSDQIKLISEMPYFKHMLARFDFPFIMRMRMMYYNLFDRCGIIHIKFV